MKKAELLEICKQAEVWVQSAGAILLSYRDRVKVTGTKSSRVDVVTEADLAVEKFLIEAIHSKYPGHNILTEERGDERKTSDFTWVIDPMDGSTDFSRGLPSFNVYVAIEYLNEVVVGVVYRPVTKELYTAVKSGGVYKNGKQTSVSQITDLQEAIVWLYMPQFWSNENEISRTLALFHTSIHSVGQIRQAWEDSANLAWLASGALDAYILLLNSPKWWDVAPGILMVEEAGGKVTDIHGDPVKNRDLSRGLVASNGKIHSELLKLVKTSTIQ